MTFTNSADQTRPYTMAMDQTIAMNALLARNWWALAIRGVLGIVFGMIAFLVPAATMLSLVLLFSAYTLVDGVFAIVAAVRAARAHERWGLLVFEGVVNIAVGVLAVLWPALTVVAFVLMVAAWALVTGALMLVAAFRLDIPHGHWWLVLGGAASVVYGVLLIVAPLIGALVLTWWLGAYAIVFGVSLLILSFKLRSRRGERPAATFARRTA
jgi:uncharacterized membrane protein HdeD (DUF308 family)